MSAQNRNIIKVSIIVPVYNVERYLDQCLQSLLHQSLEEIEIILVDDESPDHCGEMCDRYAAIDARVKVIHKKNGGLGFARNSGLEIASGEYVAFLDSDDYVDLDMYKSLYDEASAACADCCLCGYTIFSGSKKSTPMPTVNHKTILNDDKCLDLFASIVADLPGDVFSKQVPSSVCFGIYRRELIAENKLQFMSERQYANEDMIFNARLLPLCKQAVVVPQCYYNYRVNMQSISRSKKSDRLEKFITQWTYLLPIIEGIQSERFKEQIDIRCDKHVLIEAINQISVEIRGNLGQCSKLIKKICHNKLIEKVAHDLPSSALTKKQQISRWLIKNKLTIVLILMFWIKSKLE